MLRQDRTAVLDPRVVDQDIEIVPDRFRELGLAIEQVHDPQLRRETGGVGIEGRARDAALLGQRPQTGEAIAEIAGGVADRLRRHQRMAG
jgi:hypothetical protein